MKAVFTGLLFILLFLPACGPKPHKFKELPQGPINHSLIVLAKTKHGVKAKGYSKATPKNTKVQLKVADASAETLSNADGGFTLTIKDVDPDNEKAEFTFFTGNKAITEPYAIKILTRSEERPNHTSDLRKVSSTPFSLDGKEIDALAIKDGVAFVLATNASLIRNFLVDEFFAIGDKPVATYLLFRENLTTMGARSIKNMGRFMIASLFNTHEVALIDNDLSRVYAIERLKDRSGNLLRFTVEPPVLVQNPIDALSDGEKATTIKQTLARNADAVMPLDDNHFLVSFVNYYQWADMKTKEPAVLGPGIVALMRIDNAKLKSISHLITPFKNPSLFVKKNRDTVWVSCAGSYQSNDSGIFTSTGAGLVKLRVAKDLSSLTVEHEIPLGDYAIAEPALVGSKLVLPHLWQHDIIVIEENAKKLSDGQKITSNKNFSFTFASHFRDDVVFLGNAAGSLIAYSLTEGFFPFPFLEPIVLNERVDPKVMITPLNLYFRHKIGEALEPANRSGYAAWVLTESNQIYPLDFLAIFGP